MVNWHDPSLVLGDYISLVKLIHALSGAFIWEIVTSLGFELNILRGKRPYRWTLWLYLGARYTLFFAFVVFFILNDGPKVPCRAFTILNVTLPYVSWAFASLIIALRVIAIWDRDIVVSLIAIGVWAGGLAVVIRGLVLVEVTVDPLVNTCVIGAIHKSLPNFLAILVVDTVHLLAMLIGLLRHPSRRSTGLWKLLYQQCMIWMVLVALAEIPPVVFLFLNLNDVWDQMFSGPAITILTIGVTRMYRSLSEYGSITVFVSSDQPQFSSGVSIPASFPSKATKTVTLTPISFAPDIQSGSIWSACEAPVFLPVDQVLQVEFIPNMSDSVGGPENMPSEAAFTKV